MMTGILALLPVGLTVAMIAWLVSSVARLQDMIVYRPLATDIIHKKRVYQANNVYRSGDPDQGIRLGFESQFAVFLCLYATKYKQTIRRRVLD